MGRPAEIPTTTRRGLLAAGAAGAAAGAALLVPGAAADAATVARDDAPWVVGLMGVELLCLYCYEHVLSGPTLRPSPPPVLLQCRAHELAHVDALRHALTRRGARPPAGPVGLAAANHDLAHRHVSGRLGQLRGPRDALNLLLSLERVVLGAYFVALRSVREPALAVLLAQMMASGAQHVAVLHLQLHPGDVAGAIPYGLVQGVH